MVSTFVAFSSFVYLLNILLHETMTCIRGIIAFIYVEVLFVCYTRIIHVLGLPAPSLHKDGRLRLSKSKESFVLGVILRTSSF
jgi:hypothetical protein